MKINFLGVFAAFLMTLGVMGYMQSVTTSESSFNFTFTLISTSATLAGLTFVAEIVSKRNNVAMGRVQILLESSRSFILSTILFLFSLTTLYIPSVVIGTPLEWLNFHFTSYPMILVIGAICFVMGFFYICLCTHRFIFYNT
jgi:uncharacterized membrane protein